VGADQEVRQYGLANFACAPVGRMGVAGEKGGGKWNLLDDRH
jgi:hypothetical protein